MAETFTPIATANLSNQSSITTAIDQNFSTLASLLNDVLSRSGVTPNQMLNSLDMNSNSIINLPAPTSITAPVRLADINSTLTPTPAILSGNNVYTGSNTFSGTNTFSNSATFSAANTFSNSNTFSGANTFSNNNTFSGATNVFDGAFQVKNGLPWADVTAWGASSLSDSTTAIQNAINYMDTHYSGGLVIFPPGNYPVSGTITIKSGVRCLGMSQFGTSITMTGDHTVFAFDASSAQASLENLFIVGYQNAAAVNNAVTVAANVPAKIFNCFIWGGSAGLFNQGVDGYVVNCFIAGYQYGVLSNGANFYERVKLDQLFTTNAVAFYQSSEQLLTENHFNMCDFSGGDFLKSVQIADTSSLGQSVTIFTGCIFSSPITINKAQATIFNACEFGAGLTVSVAGNSGSTQMVGNFAFGTITGLGAQGIILAGNSANMS